VAFNSQEFEIVRVIVVDDHTLFTEGTVTLLSYEPRISVVGVAKNGLECLSLVSNTRADVVLLDIKLPDVCGTDLIDKIRTVQPEVKIIMLTGHSPKGYVTISRNKGANGFLLKDCSVKEMIQGILRVHNGGACFSQGMETSLQSANDSNNAHSLGNSEVLSTLLTPREIEVIELVSQGLRSKEIASAAGINVRTVDFHVSNILLKLKVNTRLEAVLKYKEGGLSDF